MAAGMVLMILVESLFWPGRGLVWQKMAQARSKAADTLAPSVSPGSGQLQYILIALDRPEGQFTNEPASVFKTLWVFRNHTEPQLAAFFHSLDLVGAASTYLTNTAHWEFLPGAIRLSPPAEIVLSLSSIVRQKLYETLAKYPDNASQARPFRFRADGFESWLADSGLTRDKIEMVRSMTYPQQGNLCFADAVTFSQLSTPEETRCLLKCLWRVSTFVIRVRLDADSDIDQIVKYWGLFDSGNRYKPLLNSLSREPGGNVLNISYFLPPFARMRLYTYPDARDPNAILQDCFWTAMNFFNNEPDNGFFDPKHTRAVLKSDYVKVDDGSKHFGDLLLLLGKDGQALHMCVRIVEDVVFTKNGAPTHQPWVLMKLPEMLGDYETSKPFEILTYRRIIPQARRSL